MVEPQLPDRDGGVLLTGLTVHFLCSGQEDSCIVWVEPKIFLCVLQKISHQVCVSFALLSACESRLTAWFPALLLMILLG